jgi:predicted RNA binding protein YcfA (HicA-like mRNA interferase family)
VCRRNAEDDTNFVAAIAMRIERDGFVFVKRTDGSHWIGEKSGVARPIVIPEYSEIGLDIIQTNMRTARMSRERYFTLLRE